MTDKTNFDVVLALPFCHLGLCFDADSLIATEYLLPSVKSKKSKSAQHNKISQQVTEYCQNPHYQFSIPIEPQGTAFQQRVWRLLQSIPPGQVMTYGEAAKQLSSSARAVGNACRANPLPLIVPCHRIVSATGLGGFAGHRSGYFTEIKRKILRHEGLEI